MKKILIVLVILISILLALIFYQKSNVNDEDGLRIIFNNRETFLTFSKINSFEKVSFSTDRGDKFEGFDFADVLKSLDISTNNDSQCVFHSKDGGTINLTKKEHEIFYLVFHEDANGQFIRLIIPTDEFSQRWIKYLIAIEIE
ncbi:MAG: hypothetical protein HQ554_04150 [FCB group bacterium]|nr:hypothetical protein [FCB group bacterium]